MTKSDIILVGGGGHCRSVIDVIETTGIYRIAGIIDVAEKKGLKVLNYDIIGTEEDLKELVKTVKNFCITVGQLKSATNRIRLYNSVKNAGGILPVIVSPLAHLSTHAQVGEGSILMHHAIVNAGAIVGTNNILNSKCLIEHDTVVGNHNHISTGAIVNADCVIGNECFVSSNVTVIRGLRINDNITVGAGSVVTKNLSHKGTYTGIPAILNKEL